MGMHLVTMLTNFPARSPGFPGYIRRCTGRILPRIPTMCKIIRSLLARIKYQDPSCPVYLPTLLRRRFNYAREIIIKRKAYFQAEERLSASARRRADSGAT